MGTRSRSRSRRSRTRSCSRWPRSVGREGTAAVAIANAARQCVRPVVPASVNPLPHSSHAALCPEVGVYSKATRGRQRTTALRFLPRADAEAVASPHRLLRRSLRADLSAARAVRHLGLQQPALPGLRELGRPTHRLLPAAVDDARLCRHVELVGPRVRLRVVHRRPGLLVRPRLLLAGRATPTGLRARLSSPPGVDPIRFPGSAREKTGATVTKAERRACRERVHDLGT
jgi:hypothetical protein